MDEKYYGEYDADGREIKHAYSESTMKEEFVVLNGIFKFAVYPKEYIKASPMEFVKKRKKARQANLFAADEGKMEIISHGEFLAISEFLREYGKKTQFIIITHRPGTMEQCDSLFGVTMQKRGVSQMLKVKLVDAIEMAEPEEKAGAVA